MTYYSRDPKALLVRLVKRDRGCKECGERRWQALEFHHIGEKDERIRWGRPQRSVTALPWADLVAEIKKCQVLCANCHRAGEERRYSIEELTENVSKNVKVTQAAVDAFREFGFEYPRSVTCKHGHPVSERGPRWQCKECARIRQRAYYHRQKKLA